jgi:D-aspartate ligase
MRWTASERRTKSRAPAVLLGGLGPALSVARTLGAMGVRVHVLADGSTPVAASRHCHAFAAPAGDDDVQRRWMRWLEHEGPRGAVLLPCQDDGLELIARHRGWLEQLGYRPVEGDDEVMLAMLDKEATYRRAHALGVAAPATVPIHSGADVERAVEEIGFPCGIKPLHSHLWQRHLHVKLVPVEDELALRSTLTRVRELGLEVLVTELVPGGDDQFVSYYTYLDERGEPLFHFTKRKLRGYPIHFGLCTYQVVEWHPDVAELGLRFLTGVGLRGVGNVEFKRDSRDGQLKLIECNHRFTASNEIVRRAGVDIARLAYARLAGADLPPVPVRPTHAGNRLWQGWDVAAFLAYRANGELTTAAWLRSLTHPFNLQYFRWTDPLPSAMKLLENARKLQRNGSRARARALFAKTTQVS